MCKGIIFLEDVKPSTRQKVLNFVKQWQSSDEWIEVSTSGSTGKPKTIKLSKTRIKVSAKATVNYFDLQPNQTILLAMSTEYIAGKMMLIRALEHQLNIVVAPVQSNPLLKQLPCQIHFSAFVPMQINAILSNSVSKQNYESIPKVIIGGAPVNFKLERQLQLLKNYNYVTFGMTETISHIAIKNITKNEPYFTGLPNVDFNITDRQQLIINAPHLLTEPLITNDIVELLNSHQFIWKGRLDNVINSGGVKLHPEVIEKKIESMLPNNRFYLIGEDDEVLGQKLILKIESDKDIDVQKINLSLKQVLTPFEMPKQIVRLTKLKETKTGKVIRE